MSSKTISMIAFFQSRNTRTPLVKFHLEQALGVFIFSFCWSVILRILFFVIPPLAPVGGILSFVPLVFIILGIINASKEQLTPLPIIGNLIADKIKL